MMACSMRAVLTRVICGFWHQRYNSRYATKMLLFDTKAKMTKMNDFHFSGLGWLPNEYASHIIDFGSFHGICHGSGSWHRPMRIQFADGEMNFWTKICARANKAAQTGEQKKQKKYGEKNERNETKEEKKYKKRQHHRRRRPIPPNEPSKPTIIKAYDLLLTRCGLHTMVRRHSCAEIMN